MARNLRKPLLATIFGALNIIFGVFGIIGLLNIKNAFSFIGVVYGVISIASSLVSVLLLAAGVYLIMEKGMALALNMYYAYASLAVTVIGAFYLIMRFGFEGMKGGVLPILIGVIYPLLIMFVLLKNDEVQSYYFDRG